MVAKLDKRGTRGTCASDTAKMAISVQCANIGMTDSKQNISVPIVGYSGGFNIGASAQPILGGLK